MFSCSSTSTTAVQAVAVFIFLCLTVQCTAQVDECSAFASTGDCRFYDCLNTKFQCTANDYPIAYGKKYCLRFADKSSCFTAEGQTWINNVRICLMKAIVNSPLYDSGTTTCEELKDFAFNSHPQCYVDSGFCYDIFLSWQNLECLTTEVITGEDLWTSRTLWQVAITGGKCSSKAISSFLENSSSSASTRFNNFISAAKDYLSCTKTIYDFVIILDSSSSVGRTNFKRIKDLIARMLSGFTIGPDDTRVGVIRYSRSSSIVIPLGSSNTYSQLATAVRGIGYSGGSTNTASALNLLTTAFSTARVSEGVSRVVAVFTDGQSNNPSATVQAAQAVHNAGIHVYSFGIGNGISNKELVAIASSGQGNVFLSGFSSSDLEGVLQQLQLSTCSTPTIMESGMEIATTIPKGSSRLLQYEFPSEGMTVKVDVTQGNLLVRGSFNIQNPNVLTQDFSVMSNGNNIDYFISPELFRQSTTDNDGRRTKRQAPTPTNATNGNLYLSIVGLNDNNTFVLNTTFGDTTESIKSSATSVLSSMISVVVAFCSFLLLI